MYLYINPQDKTVPFGVVQTSVTKKRGKMMAEFNLTGRILEWIDPHDFGNKIDLWQTVEAKHCIKIPVYWFQNDSVEQYAQVKLTEKPEIKKLNKILKNVIGTVESIHDGIAYSWFDGHGMLALPVGILEKYEYHPQSNIDLGL